MTVPTKPLDWGERTSLTICVSSNICISTSDENEPLVSEDDETPPSTVRDIPPLIQHPYSNSLQRVHPTVHPLYRQRPPPPLCHPSRYGRLPFSHLCSVSS